MLLIYLDTDGLMQVEIAAATNSEQKKFHYLFTSLRGEIEALDQAAKRFRDGSAISARSKCDGPRIEVKNNGLSK